MRRWVLAFGFAAALLAPAAGAAEIAGPPLGAVALRAMRGAGPGPVLRLAFELRRGSSPAAPLAVSLGLDYVDIVEGGRETLYDFRLRRRLMLDRGARTFTNLSLYGDVAFRRFELGKRGTLAAMFREVAHDDEPLALRPFWVESDLGMLSDVKERPQFSEEALVDGALRFSAEGKEVALFAPGPDAVPEEFRVSFLHFLRFRLPLHPDVLANIARDGRMPQRIVFVTVEGEEHHVAGLVLARSERGFVDYPLPTDFEPRPLAGVAADQEALSLRGLLPVMLAAAAGRRGNGPRPLGDYRRAIDAALLHRQGYAAALLIAEMTLQYGSSAIDCSTGPREVRCHSGEELGRLLSDDPRAFRLYKAQTRNPRDSLQEASSWEGLRADTLPSGYVIDVFLADRLSASGHRREAMGAFSRAFNGNPYLGGAYKLLGDHFLRASRTDLAWICYDLGRVLPGRPKDDALAAVGTLEQNLVAQYPGFF
jgi:hypothetical protein